MSKVSVEEAMSLEKGECPDCGGKQFWKPIDKSKTYAQCHLCRSVFNINPPFCPERIKHPISSRNKREAEVVQEVTRFELIDME